MFPGLRRSRSHQIGSEVAELALVASDKGVSLGHLVNGARDKADDAVSRVHHLDDASTARQPLRGVLA